MARVKVKVSRNAVRQLMRNASLVEGRGQAVAAACNAESSWGGYEAETEVTAIRARAMVWSIGGDEARAQRLVRNLGAE